MSAPHGINRQGITSFSNVQGGAYTLLLEGLPANCAVQGANPFSVTVGPNLANEFDFSVLCAPNVGTIHVFNDTNGDPMTEGYRITVTGVAGDPRLLPPGSNLYYDDVPVGDHNVELSDVPEHCIVLGDLVRTVTVEFDQQSSVTFNIDCTGLNGVLRVVTFTNSNDPADEDPDGYLVNVADQTIGFANDFSYDFSPIPAGDHVVTLYDVAPNCTVDGENPRTETVEVNDTTITGFDIFCSTLTGSLEVTTVSTGPSNPGGYSVAVDDRDVPIGANETVLIEGISPGDQQVLLEGVLDGCTLADNPRTIAIPGNGTALTTFQISCPTPTPPVLLESDRDGDFEIYAMNPDGSGLIQLTDNSGIADEDPSWSWDNARIVFRSTRGGQGDIWVMNADGSNPVQITDNAADNEDPELSPDGTRIVYEEEDPDDGTLEIFIANADGTNVQQLTDAPGISEAPHFRPDGSRILFKSDRDGDFEVFTMDPDGTNVVQLTSTAVDDFDASWSPDGNTIIFSSQRAVPDREDLWKMNADGSGQTQVLFDNVWDWHPVFSTDGAQIIFTSDRDGDYELFRMNGDGRGVVQLTQNSSRDDDAEYQKPIF
jgi:hypothetical protein